MSPTRNPAWADLEARVEQLVSVHIGAMPFLWLAVPDDAGGAVARGIVERNSIALLSALAGGTDGASSGWLGRHAPSPKVRHSGLWNVNHVDDVFEPTFLDMFAALVDHMRVGH